MRDHIGITCGNSSFNFLSYALVTSKAWNLISGKKIVVGLVSDFASNTDLLDFLSESIDVRPITPLPGIHPAVQAKFSRLWLAQTEEFFENIITIADLDMIPLSNSRNLLLEKCLDNQFIKWGFDHAAYSHPDNYGKWPMDGSTASGKSFQEIVNPNRISIEELVEDWSALPNLGRGNPVNEPENFSDETLLREIWPKTSKIEVVELARSVIERKPMSGRIDRSKRLPIRKVKKLTSAGAFEFHGPRPFPYKTYFGRSVLNYLEIPFRKFDEEMVSLTKILAKVENKLNPTLS